MTVSLVSDTGISGSFKFSGHETFACRYAWLPKAYQALRKDQWVFANEEGAMVELGLGKNMVRSLRFWVEAMGVAEPAPDGQGLIPTRFARVVLSSKDGCDPYLEDIRTLWLLHWNLGSRNQGALFAWRLLLSHWPFPELVRSEALAAFTRESKRLGHSHSAVTLAQHLDVFLHTYSPARGATVSVEDSLDGPLAELGFLQPIGQRKGDGGRWETVLAFRREPKPEITAALFEYCVLDYWDRLRPGEETLTLRELTLAPCSPGQVFKLPEDDIRSRLESYAVDSKAHRKPFRFQPSAVQGLLFRQRGGRPVDLASVYDAEAENA